MSYEHLIWEQDGGVGRITLNRPETLNAWHTEFGRELKSVIETDAAESTLEGELRRSRDSIHERAFATCSRVTTTRRTPTSIGNKSNAASMSVSHIS